MHGDEEEERKKKKGRKIFDIDVDEITLCGSAANKKQFFIMKADDNGPDLTELADIYQEIFDEELDPSELEKAEFSVASAREILSMLQKYAKDVPEELLDSWKKISKYLIKFASYGYPAKKSDEFISGKSKDLWPSLGMTGEQSKLSEFIQKVEYLLRNDLKTLHIDKSGQIHMKGKKKGLEGHTGGGGELDPDDKWPSFGPY